MKAVTIRYLGYYSALVAIGLLSVVATNYVVDPAHLFSDGEYERDMANFLLSGNNVANVVSYDGRNMWKIYISGLGQPKEVIVLGSSRSMQLRSSLFPGKAFINNSVPHATVEDYLAIYQLYHQRNYAPTIVVLGLDPWILNNDSGLTRWISLKEEYMAMAKSLGFSVAPSDLPEDTGESKLKELLSVSYFKESLAELLHRREEYSQVSDSSFTTAGILSDGSAIRHSRQKSRSVEQVEVLAIAFAKEKPVYALGGFAELDKRLLDTLVAFIDYLQRNAVEVIFYLPPYHPSTYRMLSESSEYSIVLRAEECFRDIARSRGIQVVGGYNPDDSDSTQEDFFDGMHPKESSAVKAFASMD